MKNSSEKIIELCKNKGNSKLTSISILGRNLFDLKQDVALIKQSGADMLHLDMLDNHFAQGFAYPISFIKDLKGETDLYIDSHFMVDDIDYILDNIIATNPDTITFHIESTQKPFYAIKKIKDAGIVAGVCVLPQTPIVMLEPVLPYIDMVLILSVTPGLSGQKPIESCFDKIKQLAKIKKEMNYNYILSVDGGINDTNCHNVSDSDILVSSSGFFNSNDKKAYIKRLSNN